MAHLSFSYKGYEIWLAAKQPSKAARGGKMRSIQVCLVSQGGRQIKKQFRYDTTDAYAFAKASKKATDWIDEQLGMHGAMSDGTPMGSSPIA